MKNINYIKNSLHNVAIEWFIVATTGYGLSSNFDSEIYIKQWLMFLLRCIHNYEHVRSFCGTMDYIELLLYIYQNTRNSTTSLLAFKILHKIIIFFNDILFSIGDHCCLQNTTNEIITELFYIYRTIISYKSSWQLMAIQTIKDTIILNLELFEFINSNKINSTLGSLFVVGGYTQPITNRY
ncbi:unnamed protein product [Rotaria sp. Silwood2]|nr:unnamed protein product [Rotaria sp. Silwood2]